MAWYGKGAERVKHYAVYQELEKNYIDAVKHIIELESELATKNQAIRTLAALLSRSGSQEPSGPSLPEGAINLPPEPERPSEASVAPASGNQIAERQSPETKSEPYHVQPLKKTSWPERPTSWQERLESRKREGK